MAARSAEALEPWARRQPERLCLDEAEVVQVATSQVVYKVPGYACDGESPHVFRVEVVASLDPATGQVSRCVG